jgi:hypothetical protein
MVMMVRQQMICIIAPDWSGGADHIRSETVQESLKKLFCDVGVVHFASIALLPAMSDARGQLPSLMLELAVEEGLCPYDLLYRLVYHPGGAMRLLYGGYLPAREPPPPTNQLNQELLDRLMSWHHVADGGFVGARDRSVQQIEMEKDLLGQTRDAARALKAQHGWDRASFALALARWAIGNPDFEWALEPAPRSFWRRSGASIIAKAAYPVAIIGLWLALLWLVGVLSRCAARTDAWFFGRSSSVVQTVFGAVSEANRWLLGVSYRFLLALVVVGFALWIFFVALPALFALWRRWLDSLGRELDRPTETWSSFLTYVSVWLMGAPLVLAGFWGVVVYTFWPKVLERVMRRWMPAVPGWKLLVIAAFAILVLVGIGMVFSRLDRLLPKLNAWFYRPHEDDVERAQQVHRSIEECEARLVCKTAHMISLTDMREPHWWSVWWTRLFLRLVTFLGRVLFTETRLGDAPGIHFGHWHIIDNGRRYLFCSNYDGNFGGYLDDFINGASAGTTLFWRWTKLMVRAPAADGQPGVAEPRAFPPTRFLAFRGVKCELKFKSYARDSMLPHLYRFDACNTTMDEIDRATALRNALFGERNDCNDDQIMRAIES